MKKIGYFLEAVPVYLVSTMYVKCFAAEGGALDSVGNAADSVGDAADSVSSAVNVINDLGDMFHAITEAVVSMSFSLSDIAKSMVLIVGHLEGIAASLKIIMFLLAFLTGVVSLYILIKILQIVFVYVKKFCSFVYRKIKGNPPMPDDTHSMDSTIGGD